MAEKNNKKALFWTSYSDLMTSLFFTFLVLFVVTTIIIAGKARANGEQLKKIQDIENSVQLIDKQWFGYNEKHKKHILNIDVTFPTGVSSLQNVSKATLRDLRLAGKSIEAFLDSAEQRYAKDVEYLLIIEGQASNDGYVLNDELSYKRALALYKYLTGQCKLNLDRPNCEVLICGSGTHGTLRALPDISTNKKNQRFLIHILPKPGFSK